MLPAPLVVSLLAAPVPATAPEPWTRILAGWIRDEGYGCAEVVHLAELGFEHDGRAAVVICRATGPRDQEHRSYRVVFYTEGDITVRPWRQEAQR